MARSAILFLCLIVVSVGYAQIGAKTPQEKIIGIWQNNQFATQMTLILNADGSGEFAGEPIRFSTQTTTLSITLGGTITNYNYTLDVTTLTLSGGDIEGQVIFIRNGSKVGQDAEKTINSSSNKTDIKVIGLWSGSGEMIEFRADGKCIYLGNTFPYQISQGHIILTSGQGNVSFVYEVKGAQLILTANGQKVTYNKVEGTEPVSNTNTKGKVALELVGTWCYMNMNTNSQTSRCITLNGDGSYTYHAESSRSVNTETVSGGTSSQGDDRGTWYAQGDRIYYNSPTSGQGSYRLEKRNHPKNVNDPMIVLDGEPYVTATLRNPWR